MTIDKQELNEISLIELNTSEKLQISGGSGLTYGAGWIIGRYIASVGFAVAAACVAVTLSMIDPYGGKQPMA